VIPTGSMGPTLVGLHKDVKNPLSGKQFAVNASIEEESRLPVVGAVSPHLREPMSLDPRDGFYPTYSGDRILVSKFAYELWEPQRWDVFVFKYPLGASTN